MESEMGNGTSFYLTFPDAGSQSSGFISPDRTEAKLNKRGSPVILLAEDDESNATLLGVIFDKASIKFLIAKNGMEAVDLCLSHPEISLVLMDIKMPLMDGLIATRKIKEFRKNLPIIGVTAYAMTRDKEKALEAGCDEYLTKPLKPDLLLETIKSLL
jgi:CheY-like chemotaxis protein